jgi:hypothetical protein
MSLFTFNNEKNGKKQTLNIYLIHNSNTVRTHIKSTFVSIFKSVLIKFSKIAVECEFENFKIRYEKTNFDLLKQFFSVCLAEGKKIK